MAQSSQSFVRALKAPSDPPQPGGPFKIDIARSVWDDASFYIPSKGEVVVDWILTRLLKDKSKNSETNLVLDSRFWTLLYDIISPASQKPNARPVKSWLPPLLSRIPIASIAISFLGLSASLDDVSRQRLAHIVHRCFIILWPLGVHKMSSDILSECFSAVLGTFKECESNDNLAHISLLIVSSFRSSLGNASNKKKLYGTFMESQLYPWMECALQSSSSSVYRNLLENIYAAGVEAVFNPDMLRQHHDSISANPLFEALVKNIGTSSSLVTNVLPRIFDSYVLCLKKHRGSLFSQSSSQFPGSASEELRSACMKFFGSCYSTLDHAGNGDQLWTARIALLSIIETEDLFSPSQRDMDQLLKQNVELAIEALSFAWKADHVGESKLAIDVLSSLTRIDHDLVSSAIPRILPKLYWPPVQHNQTELISQILELNTSASVFLDLLLDYHVKTRSIHIYIQYLFTALAAQPSALPLGSRSLYQVASSGPLLNLSHLDRLGKYVHSFLTSGQLLETVRKVLNSLEYCWKKLQGTDDAERSRKRRKVDGAGAKTSDDEFWAVSFSLTSRIASAVLGSLPLQTAAENVRSDIHALVEEAQTVFISACLTQTLKAIRKRGSRDVWASQIVAAATLRLQYALDGSGDIPSQVPDGKILSKILDMLDDCEILPELHLEMFRILLAQSARGLLENPKAFLDSLFHYLGQNFTATGITWCGLPCQLTFGTRGKKEAALALFHLILDRWITVIDDIGSSQHLGRMGDLLLSINGEENLSSSSDVLRPSACLIHALRSAEFWELPNMRNILLSALNDRTSILGQIDSSQIRSSDMQQVRHAISAYDKLLFVPIEYISRTSRTEFVKRALSADIVVRNLSIGEDVSESYCCRSLTVLRTFLKRVFVHLGAVDHATITKFLAHLLNTLGSPGIEFSLVTLDLIEVHFMSILRSSNTQAILEILKHLTRSLLDSTRGGFVQQRAFGRLVGLLEKSFSLSDFPEEVRAAMIEHRERLLTAVLPQMVAVTTEGVLDYGTQNQIESFTMWCNILSYGQWLHLNDAPTPKFGRRLVTSILSSPRSLGAANQEDMCAAILAIILEELYSYSDDHRSRHVEVIVAAYISISRKFESFNPMKFDVHISKTCKSISVSDFSHVLDFISEELANSDHAQEDLACLTRLSVLLLHEAPQGTLQPIQNFITQCLSLFSGLSTFSVGTLSLRLQVLDFVGKHCSDRSAFLRSTDLNNIWSLLSKFLAKSEDHDGSTSTTIFNEIVNIVSALIRLRRDLVVSTLPHLGMILRQLIMSVRGVRPQLGAKQSKFVTDTLPRWINASQPLTSNEGKILARLLVAVTTKSIVRTHSSQAQKAESLAKPFSKHAAYVLKAYIEVMNDPLCVVGLELRRELEPGLFALCSMLSEHSRDAMMVSALDAGGKTTLKLLWKEYEKQKYVGKG